MVVRLLTSTGYFNSRPHEEVDRSRQGVLSTGLYFNSRPHEEVDITSLSSLSSQLYFNSRPHEEVDVSMFKSIPTQLLFQLTTSRGGRPQFLRKKFSFLNHFLCLLHIIYSYYINTIFFSTLFFAKS